mgnify:CR=1 FL=1
MNKVILIGNLTAKPQLKSVGEHTLVDFQVASKRKFKNADGEYDTDFISCVAWNKTAELISKMEKGEKIAFVGTLQVRNYEDQQGNKRTRTEVLVEELDFVSGAKPKQQEEQITLTEIDESSLPF